ncbi:hypothetical protein [Prevotella nigrescens]|nr:hypothetical protein [Prevotella nigrescens]
MNEFKRAREDKLVDSHLNICCLNDAYQYSDIILVLFCVISYSPYK